MSIVAGFMKQSPENVSSKLEASATI